MLELLFVSAFSIILGGFSAGAVGDAIADSDAAASFRAWADHQWNFLGDLVSCRFCVAAWAACVTTPLALFLWGDLDWNWYLFPALALNTAAAWKLSTVLRGMNE